MYLQHFGLAQYPFSLTPNTHYYLKFPDHQTAFNLLNSALMDSSSFLKITGEVGIGKTMLCRKMINALEASKNRYITAYIPHPILNVEATMRTLAEELSIEAEEKLSYYELLKLITEKLVNIFDEEKYLVVFIDEAQAIPEETLEAIRLLTTIDHDHGSRLQVVLFGQPELDKLLEQPTLSELNSNLSFSYQLTALDRAGVETYVEHRLFKAGYNGAPMFTGDALELLCQDSQGIPRLINILAHKALMLAFGKGDQLISEKHVFKAILNTESVQKQKSSGRRLFVK